MVLGRPGAGCSTLLKTLANHRADYHAVHGDVFYDTFTPAEISKQVKETLDFAAKTRTPQTRIAETRREHRETITDILATIFGLRHVKDTLVGDARIRGVSGGEKKRVSISEVLATRSRIMKKIFPVPPVDLSA